MNTTTTMTNDNTFKTMVMCYTSFCNPSIHKRRNALLRRVWSFNACFSAFVVIHSFFKRAWVFWEDASVKSV